MSSYRLSQHEYVWYLGGSLAEKGANMDAESLIEKAKSELADLLPWLDFEHAQWATLPVTRAEPLQPNFIRPDNAFAEPASGIENLIVAWPTKLTLVPNLANQILAMLQKAGITPNKSAVQNPLHDVLPVPPIAATPWDLAFPPEVTAEAVLSEKFFPPPVGE